MIAFLFSSRFAVKMNESRIVWSLSKKRKVLELEGEDFSQPDEHAKEGFHDFTHIRGHSRA